MKRRSWDEPGAGCESARSSNEGGVFVAGSSSGAAETGAMKWHLIDKVLAVVVRKGLRRPDDLVQIGVLQRGGERAQGFGTAQVRGAGEELRLRSDGGDGGICTGCESNIGGTKPTKTLQQLYERRISREAGLAVGTGLRKRGGARAGPQARHQFVHYIYICEDLARLRNHYVLRTRERISITMASHKQMDCSLERLLSIGTHQDLHAPAALRRTAHLLRIYFRV